MTKKHVLETMAVWNGLPQLALRLPEKKKNEKRVWLLGSKDMEMMRIRQVLEELGEEFTFAMQGGKRVTPRNCYEADPVIVKDGYTLFAVECEPKDFLGYNGLLRTIDHHRKGDPGWQCPPSEYYRASSLGQVLTGVFGREPTAKDLVIAARDHCRFEANRGKCPGVSRGMVNEVGRDLLSAELDVTRAVLDNRISHFRDLITDSPRIRLGDEWVVDLTHQPVGMIYSLDHMSAYEAAADKNRAVLIRARNTASDPEKVVLVGAHYASTIAAFREYAHRVGLVGTYADEVRLHAGAYIQEQGVEAIAKTA